MATTIPCLTDDELCKVLTGELMSDAIEEHLRSCAICRGKLDQLTESEMFADATGATSTSNQHGFLEPAQGNLGKIDQFLIQEQVARGGSGIVFKAVDQSLQRTVAVKVLWRIESDASAERFERESQIAAGLNNDYLVQVFSFGKTIDGRPYLVMPLIKGQSLREKISQELLSFKETAALVRHVALGLQELHRAGQIHRDVKPGNILFDESSNRAKLTDFGLARNVDETHLTQANVISGTPEYMSPEQATDPDSVGAPSDIYSLGISLYECLCGTVPFVGKPIQVLEQHRNVDPIPPTTLNRSIPKDLETICLKAIAKQPGRRYRSAVEFADDLHRFLDARPIKARETTNWERLTLWCYRNPAIATLLGLTFTVLLTGITSTSIMWHRSTQNANEALAYADQLDENRSKLREAVSRFQKRILGDEGLHLQMTHAMRDEMFSDMISYLDEFAEYENNQVLRRDKKHSPDVPLILDLTNDYLAVAKAASEVGELEEADLAIDRVHQRLDQLENDSPESRLDRRFLELRLESTRLALQGYRRIRDLGRSLPIQSEPGIKRREKLLQIANDCLRKVENLETDPSLFRLMECEIDLLAKSTAHKLNQKDLDELQSIHEEVMALNDLNAASSSWRIRCLRPAIECQLLRAAHLPAERSVELLENHSSLLPSYREGMRAQNNLPVSDLVNALYYSAWAARLIEVGKIADAAEVAEESCKHWNFVLETRSQNRDWLHLASLEHFLLAELNRQLGNANDALASSVTAIRLRLKLVKTDPSDFVQKKLVVRMFVYMSWLNAQNNFAERSLNEIMIAIRDCYIITRDEESRVWAYDAYVHLSSKACQMMKKLPNEARDMAWKKECEGFLEKHSDLSDSKNITFEKIKSGEVANNGWPEYLVAEKIPFQLWDETR